MSRPPEHSPPAGWLLPLVLAMTWLAAACGVPLQDTAAPIQITSSPSENISPGDGPLNTTVYLVRKRSLLPVQRSTDEVTLEALLGLLDAGPTNEEQQAGVSTALPPGAFDISDTQLVRSADGDRVAVVAVTDTFTSTGGNKQLLATAQVVCTLTTAGIADAVQFSSGAPIEVPTDAGLRGRPVDASYYTSVAPDISPTATPPDPVTE